jgi:hypothetical protein
MGRTPLPGVVLLLAGALSLSSWLAPATAQGQPLAPEAVPPPLRPWMSWVLYGSEKMLCPAVPPDDGVVCAWGGTLRLELGPQGGRWSQSWEVYADSDVPLPGDRDRPPLDVRAGNRSLAVLAGEAGPAVRLPAGRHELQGSFAWRRLPESLPVPPETGLVTLRLGGQEVRAPRRDQGGALFLGAAAAAGERPQESDRLDIEVHRKVTDEVPLLLTTSIQLVVAGKTREVVLGRALPEGFVPHALAGALPARLEPDGRLRVQVRPGTFTVTLEGRREAPAPQITRGPAGGPWKAGDEVWVFEARPHLRLTTVEGVPAVDPRQTTVPGGWRALPAYLVAEGASMRLHERRRGDAEPAPDQLRLQRQLWLDFDGGGYTVRDHITGRLGRSWRLDMGEEGQLGRVAVAGVDQFITRLPGGPAGVELRQGNLAAQADSRFERSRFRVPAVAWQHDFQQVSATLALPPGWRLMHAAGADDVRTTWLERWSLLDLFLVLVVAIAVLRLFGRWQAGVALLTLLLILQEPDAPAWVWLAVIVGEALVRALPAGQLRRAAKLYRLAAALALLFIALPFAAGQARVALHPALGPREGGYAVRYMDQVEVQTAGFGSDVQADSPQRLTYSEETARKEAETPRRRNFIERKVKTDAPAAAPPAELSDSAAQVGGVAGGIGISSLRGAAAPAAPARAAAPPGLRGVDPDARVQTGPGIPSWQWSAVALSWNGPVERGARLALWLAPPWLTGLLGLAGAVLVTLASLLLLRNALGAFAVGRWLPGVAGALLALCQLLLGARPARAQEFPPKELLDGLRTRLTERPACSPRCASFGRLVLEGGPERVRLTLPVVASAAATAVELPGLADQFQPQSVTLDGRATTALRRGQDGRLWLLVPVGTHQVVLEGPLGNRPSVQIAFGSLRPPAVEARLRGFTLSGVAEDGTVGESLELVRGEAAGGGPRPGAPAGEGAGQALPAFVGIERTLSLDLEWRVETRVVRQTQPGAAVVIEVPLLPNESVLSAGAKVAGGKVQVNMGPSDSEVSWTSALAHSSPIVLRAPAGPGPPASETWRLDVSPIWHAQPSGIPPVHPGDAGAGARTRTWRPWPGEAVSIAVTRPAGTPGNTFTIDSSELELRPGARSTDATLSLSLRSSRGGEHALTLPEGAALQSLHIGGEEQPLRQEGRKVTVPLTPGAQQLVLGFRSEAPLAVLYRTPPVDLGAPSVNAGLRVQLPADRWVLLVGGPRLGPAVLIWSLLVVLVIAALLLARSPLAPLRMRQWVLLGLGFAPLSLWAAVVVAGLFFALGWRRDLFRTSRPWLHDLVQVLLVVWTLVALGLLFVAVQQGLLSTPDMMVAGNGSSPTQLAWSSDRAGGRLPGAWALSLPLGVYHLAMLAWALWLAASLIRWARWAWSCFTEAGLWRPLFGRKLAPARPEPDAPGEPPAAS